MDFRRTCILGAALTLATTGRASAGTPKNETAAERRHRKGVHCMDVIEREKCAIRNFEALLEETTTQRELMTDGMLRLIRLYQKAGRQEDVKPLLRRFWEVGMKRESKGHVPYSARYLPPEMTMFVNIDTDRVIGSQVLRELGPDARDLMFTCDEARRRDIFATMRWKRASHRAKIEGKKPYEVIYEERDKRDAARQARTNSSTDESRGTRRKSRGAPIFSEVACPIAKAFGQEDLLAWKRMAGGIDHRDFRRSVAIAEIPGLDGLLTKAVDSGQLEAIGKDRWVLPDVVFANEPVHLARLDRDELTVATKSMLDPLVAARTSRRRRMNRSLAKLIGRVPKDTGFFFVVNATAMGDLGLGGMKESRRKLAELVLPKPKGLQIAGVLHNYFGLFTRMPTDNPVKGRMLVNFARMLIDGESDPQTAAWLKHLDVAEANDKRALLATYVVSSAQIETLLFNY